MSLFGPPLLLVAALVAVLGAHAVAGDITAMEESWAKHDTAA
jgi:hypothetical protein